MWWGFPWLFKMYDTGKDKKRRQNKKEQIENEKRKEEEEKMEKTMKIEGMMCGHCEARVKKCLEAIEQVESAAVSHQEGTAVVTLSGAVEDEVLKKAVEEQDYRVVEIK